MLVCLVGVVYACVLKCVGMCKVMWMSVLDVGVCGWKLNDSVCGWCGHDSVCGWCRHACVC